MGKTVMLRIRLDKDERRLFESSAHAAGLTVSEFVRRVALGKAIRPRIPVADVKALALVRQCVGLLKQIYKEELADPAATWSALTAAERLSAKLQREAEE